MNTLITIVRCIWLIIDSRLFRRFMNYWRFIWWSAKLEELGKGSKICKNVIMRAPNNISIGNGVIIAEFVHIWGGGGVEIGNDSIIASHVAITSQTHDTHSHLYKVSSVMQRVIIGSNVWIGSGAIILPGIRIGDNSIIGAGSVVTKDVQKNTIVFGAPARIYRAIK